MPVPDMPDGPTLLDDWRAGLAELISTLIFVFAGEGAGMAFNKLNSDSSTTPPASSPPPLPTPSLCSLQSPSVQEYPAATSTPPSPSELSSEATSPYFEASSTGSLSFSARPCLPAPQSTPTFALSAGVGVWNAVVFEIVMTFGLVYTVYATAVDRKKGDVGVMAPIAIGFVVGGNILAGGAFDGASMNPAISFGPALVSWSWENHWVYWVGPLIGGGLAGLLYELESEICISF